MLKQRIEEDLKKAVGSLGYPATDIVLSIPKNAAFGDYTSNIALQLAKLKSDNVKQSPQEIANKIVSRVKSPAEGEARQRRQESRVEVKDGFINFFIKDQVLVENLGKDANPKADNPQKIMVEYGHANVLKEAHIGHLRTYALGESLCRILDFLGNQVFRANYQSDIGLNIAQTIWGIEKTGWPEKELSSREKANFFGQAYALGKSKYNEDLQAKGEMDKINQALYQKDPQYEVDYQKARDLSLKYYEEIYKLLGISYDRLFFESEVAQLGKEIVLKNSDGIFQKSEGAIIFPGEEYGLHNRVFVNSAGNPTYEAKDMGLAKLQYEAFSFDKVIHVVANEQEGYFQVIFKAIELLFPHLKNKEKHLSYGMVKFKEGKMSSRTGEVITITNLFDMVAKRVKEIMKESDLLDNENVVSQITLGAIKFAYLKFSPGSDIVFDIEQSVSLQGDSGPYLQYTYARIQSVLKKADTNISDVKLEAGVLEPEERALLRRLEYFVGVVEQAAREYRPNTIGEYLLDLAREFNLFYQKHRIIQSDKKNLRIAVSGAVGQVLKQGLYLLGIEAPERM